MHSPSPSLGPQRSFNGFTTSHDRRPPPGRMQRAGVSSPTSRQSLIKNSKSRPSRSCYGRAHRTVKYRRSEDVLSLPDEERVPSKLLSCVARCQLCIACHGKRSRGDPSHHSSYIAACIIMICTKRTNRWYFACAIILRPAPDKRNVAPTQVNKTDKKTRVVESQRQNNEIPERRW